MERSDGKNAPESERKVGSSPAQIADPRLAFEARRAFMWVLVVGAAVLTVYMARSLLVVFGGMVFAAMIDGGARLLGRVLKIGRAWRIAIVLTLGVVFLIAVVIYAGTTIAQQAAELPRIVEEQLHAWAIWAQSRGVAVDANAMQSFASQLASGVGTVTRALSGLLGGIASMILIGFLGIYISLEPRLYERGIAWMLPEDRREDFYITGSLMARQLRHLLGGRLFGMVVEGIFTWAMLTGYALVNDGVPVPMAVLLGLITGTLAFIPNVGAVISGVLMVLVGFSGGTEMGLYTIFVYFFVQTIDGNILVPLIAKKTVDLAPALVLATQLILGVMFGVLGLALADPLVAMIKVALERRSAKYDAARDAQTEVQAEAL
ncbi:AI-2E family transporter [Altererythrobacter sp. CC-YST694]|uniref:AI-2E family transporter n=1 Tax=Altererythrobacter sp. CC-YST694 TaxID=2755038 RepID=UPI001D01CF02|nr:AI-2E family transporter [Altererythrobacter sp. CC-YST694]MCB5423993.1 AI-2E family transporter [Altererythrobacter sp. CC-YST694]